MLGKKVGRVFSTPRLTTMCPTPRSLSFRLLSGWSVAAKVKKPLHT